MNKSIKTVLLITGVILIGYGIYTLIQPESQISIGDLDLVKTQENTDSYITIALGIIAAAIGLIKSSK